MAVISSVILPPGLTIVPKPANHTAETLSIDVGATETPDHVARPPAKGPPPLELPPRYEDLGQIAGGASGDVRRIHDKLLGRVLAMKVLRWECVGIPSVRARFFAEAQLTAGLQHPGIVAVHERGELPDGRLWFTMKEVRGRTLAEVVAEVHDASSPEGFRDAPSGWTFRRLVDAFARISQAVAYAHSRGIVHRDLKPDNLMVGEFGEVLVMDWGLARRISDPEPEIGEADTDVQVPPSHMTRHGDVLGTPAYMPPEQARGQRDLHGPESDVYALGAILYHLLVGRPPYTGDSISVVRQVRAGPPKPIELAALKGPPIPAELIVICNTAMRREISERYPSAESLMHEILIWLDGARRREQGLAVLAKAQALLPQIARLRAQSAQMHAEARELLEPLRPFDPVEKKLPGWRFEDKGADLQREASLLEITWLQKVHGALSLDPELSEAHALLADHYREHLADAELGHRDDEAARCEVLLRAHDRGRHAAFLRGDGTLSLVTDPPGASVTLYRYVLRDRRLEPSLMGSLGPTPIRALKLQRGSYLLVIRAAGRAEVRYPVLIERDAHWDGCPPGESEPFAIPLPREDELGPDDVYVPAGYCWTGGDPSAGDSLPRRRVWVDGLVIHRFPVTNREYLEFLNDLVAQGRAEDAVANCPRAHLSIAESIGQLAFSRDQEGRFLLPPQDKESFLQPDWSVVLIDWHEAMAYSRWLSERAGLPLRLPDEIEREKATRGADGRLFAWGNHFDATWGCTVDSHPDETIQVSVHSYPLDESPYGVRGLSGNTRDWCGNIWTREGPEVLGGRLRLATAAEEDPEFRAVRGGAWVSPSELSRAAVRFGARPATRRTTMGVRLVRSYPR